MVFLGHPESQDKVERQDPLDSLECQDLKEIWVLEDQREAQAFKDQEVTLKNLMITNISCTLLSPGCNSLSVYFQVNLENLVGLEFQERWDHPEKMA